ncbi:MAG: hypothetical protein J6T10_27630 [Methanobrevibacter sp.]|nr:hypothetical protein [Methanobrevibacter sp.]
METLAIIIGWFGIGCMALFALLIPIFIGCIYFDHHYISFKSLFRKSRKWHRYSIAQTSRMFGFFSWEENYTFKYKPLAENAEHAMKRYFRWYQKHYKERAKGSLASLRETTYDWATYLVTDLTTGDKTYFH